MVDEREKVEAIVLIYEPTDAYLNERQRVAYRGHPKKLIKWLSKQGKAPEKLEGYAHDMYYTYANVIDQFHRFVWDETDGFTLDLTHEHADEYPHRTGRVTGRLVQRRGIKTRDVVAH
jgi:hypothetical protein